MGLQALSSMLWSLVTVRHHDAQLLVGAAAVVQQPELEDCMTAHQIAACIWSLAAFPDPPLDAINHLAGALLRHMHRSATVADSAATLAAAASPGNGCPPLRTDNRATEDGTASIDPPQEAAVGPAAASEQQASSPDISDQGISGYPDLFAIPAVGRDTVFVIKSMAGEASQETFARSVSCSQVLVTQNRGAKYLLDKTSHIWSPKDLVSMVSALSLSLAAADSAVGHQPVGPDSPWLPQSIVNNASSLRGSGSSASCIEHSVHVANRSSPGCYEESAALLLGYMRATVKLPPEALSHEDQCQLFDCYVAFVCIRCLGPAAGTVPSAPSPPSSFATFLRDLWEFNFQQSPLFQACVESWTAGQQSDEQVEVKGRLLDAVSAAGASLHEAGSGMRNDLPAVPCSNSRELTEQSNRPASPVRQRAARAQSGNSTLMATNEAARPSGAASSGWAFLKACHNIVMCTYNGKSVCILLGSAADFAVNPPHPLLAPLHCLATALQRSGWTVGVVHHGRWAAMGHSPRDTCRYVKTLLDDVTADLNE